MIFLSFDVEEFDTPRRYGSRIAVDRQFEITTRGTERLLDTLSGLGVRATFFCTGNFAQNRPQIIKNIARMGHEIASHSFYHGSLEIEDLMTSRKLLQDISGQAVVGFKSTPKNESSVQNLITAGYLYDITPNPSIISIHNSNLSQAREIFMQDGLTIIPQSVTHHLRLPLHWLALHNYPLELYKYLTNKTLQETGILNINFQSWEFIESIKAADYKLPYYITNNSGESLIFRLSNVIDYFKSRKEEFGTLAELVIDR